jgi:hypothetical protein
VGATAEEISPTRQEDRENRVLGTHNSIQSRTARDGLFSALTRLLFLDGFVVCPVVAGLHTALRQIGRFRVDCMYQSERL